MNHKIDSNSEDLKPFNQYHVDKMLVLGLLLTFLIAKWFLSSYEFSPKVYRRVRMALQVHISLLLSLITINQIHVQQNNNIV
jgi:hypothetical protein